MLRTHYCGEPDIKLLDKEVEICGWVNTRRDHGGLVFIDLRDRTGIVQCVSDPEIDKQIHKLAQDIRDEFVLSIKGKVRRRPEGTINKNIKTGEIEIVINKLVILNTCKVLPFQITETTNVAEEVRLKYRYLDLRRHKMFNNFHTRHKITFLMRDFLDKNGFMEVETPILLKSTPEGARDYLVPSRVNEGEFYALPQSPQMLKQILMVSGFDKYFQVAKCFRDEDLRADRQPEFTQIDMEMSFIEENDIMTIIENMVAHVFRNVLNVDVKTPFPRISHEEAMRKYGSDKPDLRYGLELADITQTVASSEFKVFLDVVSKKGIVKAINAKGCGNFSRLDIDNLTNFVKEFGAKGLAYFKVTAAGLESNIAKYFKPEILKEIQTLLKGEDGDLIMIIADKPFVTNQCLDFLRRHLAVKLNLIPKDAYVFEWVVDFPLFNYNETEKRFEPEHHPFTAPRDQDLGFFDTGELGKMKARAYDLVLNGTELGGGSIRIHSKDIQAKLFKTIGISDEDAKERFGFLLEAFEYGAPPHGGIALGLDRMCMLMLGEDSLRDVIVFPKTQRAQCLLTGAPSKVDEKQLRELHVKVSLPVKVEKKPEDGKV